MHGIFYGGASRSLIHLIKRLSETINGLEKGVSKKVDWTGGGDFVYCELLPYNQLFIEQVITAEISDELLSLWQTISEHSFLKWYINPDDPEEAEQAFMQIGEEENGLEKQKRLLIELLDKNQLYVNLSEIDDERFGVSEEDKHLNRLFYEGPHA